MRKLFKYLFVFLASFFVIIVLPVYLYKGFVVNNLKDKTRMVEAKWSELYQNSSSRVMLLKELTSDVGKKGSVFDSLKMVLESDFKSRNKYKNECSLDFVKQEYELNKQYFKFLTIYKNDSALGVNDVNDIVEQLKNNDKSINAIVDDYNNMALDLNRYISTFPNFFFAKGNGFTKKKFFTIKYGVENEDPIVKSKELPEWAKEVDTL